ncbi:4-amino-4-deoxychorismate lyase [Propioniciclava tarda]|nr:4-amino-4-deoxychorismate lyase [Propioniciclava tarda]
MVGMSDLTLCLIDRPTAPPGESVSIVDADPLQATVLATDFGVNRGDGIFEVAGCVDGRVHALDAHLRRFARSASMLDLPKPNSDAYAEAVRRAIAPLCAQRPGQEVLVKFVLTRGQEMGGTGGPAGWAIAYPCPDFAHDRSGIDVVTLDRGVRSDIMRTTPWLLGGAKTLSYAANKAALREAKRRGADDVLFVSTDGHALEGPSSSLIARINGVLVTPHPDEGVLAGTTQADVFAYAEEVGFRTETRPVLTDELAAADALWLTSSGRLCAPVKSLDGRPMAVDAALTAEWNDHLLARS